MAGPPEDLTQGPLDSGVTQPEAGPPGMRADEGVVSDQPPPSPPPAPEPQPTIDRLDGGALSDGWHPDPFSRAQYRYMSQGRWTEQVANQGIQSVDHVPGVTTHAGAPGAGFDAGLVLPTASTTLIDDGTRRARLTQALSNQLARGDMRIESQLDWSVILVRKGQEVNHVLHGILTVLTCVWGIVWAVLASRATKEERYMLTVDGFGNVMTQKLT